MDPRRTRTAGQGDRPTVEAVREYFGELPDECALGGEESALSTAKAERELDWQPRHEWRQARAEDVPTPELTE